MIKDKILQIIGAGLIIFGLLFVAVGIVDLSEKGVAYGVGAALMGIILFSTPGLFLFLFGRKLAKEEKVKYTNQIVGILRTYRRIKISDIAAKINKTVPETERLIGECVRKGLIAGHIDRTTNEFFTEESLGISPIGIKKCPNCGAPISTRALRGESVICDYCGTNLSPTIGKTVKPQIQSPAPPCPFCGKELTYIAQYQKWYCYQCKKYIQP
jgi:ribosomal protein L37AE/L43A